MQEFSYKALRALNGVFCVYKPAGVPMGQICHSIRVNLAKDLNGLKHRPPKKIIHVHEENIGTNLPVITSVPDLTEHSLVIGPRFEPEDFRLKHCCSLSQFGSGVSVFSVGSSKGYLHELVEARHLKVYHIKGTFGVGTEDFTNEGKIIEKTTYKHITQYKLEQIITAMQASHQRFMYQSAGVNLQSQEAYELAAQGLIRPAHNKTPPIVYGIKCIDFKLPHFTLEVHAINETVPYLLKMVHEMGLELKSTACASQVRRIRFGYFGLQHALLRSDWKLNEIISNIGLCRPLLRKGTLDTDHQMKKLTAQGQKSLPSTFTNSVATNKLEGEIWSPVRSDGDMTPTSEVAYYSESGQEMQDNDIDSALAKHLPQISGQREKKVPS